MSEGRWWQKAWNVAVGCSAVSPACDNCWAAQLAATRLKHLDDYKLLAHAQLQGNGHDFRTICRWNGTVRVLPRKLTEPLHWRKPQRIFVCNTGDMFHDGVTDEFLDQVFGIILATRVTGRRHKFFVLTKRAMRMREYFSAPPKDLLLRWAQAFDATARHGRDGGSWYFDHNCGEVTLADAVQEECSAKWDDSGVAVGEFATWGHYDNLFPLPNLWLGVTAENPEWLHIRATSLIQTPAAHRYLSLEPLLSELSVEPYLWLSGPSTAGPFSDCLGRKRGGHKAGKGGQMLTQQPSKDIDWVAIGAESGPHRRPCRHEWVGRIVSECVEAGVPVFVKQLSGSPDGTGRVVQELDLSLSPMWRRELP